MDPANASSLGVYFEDELVGYLFDTAPLSFEYAPTWLQNKAIQIANITLGSGRTYADGVTSFFENLLPEGDLRAFLFSSRKASTLFGLLYAVAGDTAGGFVLLPAGQTPQPQQYEATSWAALAEELKTKPALSINTKGKSTRISLAGAQDKVAIAIFNDSTPRLGIGTSPSTHILKPDIKRMDGVWSSAINETIIMKTASQCGLGVANVFFQTATRSCVVERFDRYLRPDGGLGRVMQYDLCQLSSLPSGKKYEAEGGPSLWDCAQLIRKYSTLPAVDLKRLVQWVVFNIFVGNNDSHAKNLSIYSPASGGVRLTPFYDLLCTGIYPGLSRSFAFKIGGSTVPSEFDRSHIMAMAEQLNLRPKFVLGMCHEVGEQIPKQIAAVQAQIVRPLNPSDATLADRLVKYVEKNTRQTLKRMAAIR